MENHSFENFGFSYEFDGREFSFVVVAASEAEARERVKVMSTASFVGVVRESCLDPEGSPD